MYNEQNNPASTSSIVDSGEVKTAIAQLTTLAECDAFQQQQGWNNLPLSEFHHVTGDKNSFYRKLRSILKEMEANGEIRNWKIERNKRFILERGSIGPFESLEDFWEFYKTHDLGGLTRKEMIYHEQKEYRSFYSLLKKRLKVEFGTEWDKAMNAFFPTVRFRSNEIEAFRSIDEFENFFMTHSEFHGYTRTEIRNNVVEGSAFFYDRLLACIAHHYPENPTKQEEVLSNFFESQQQRYPSLNELTTIENVISYIKEHEFFGIPRSAAWQNTIPGSKRAILKLSEMLARAYPEDTYEQESRLNAVFPSSSFQEYKFFTSLDEFRSYIDEHEELQQKRSVLQKNEIDGGRAFFDALQKFIQSNYPEVQWETLMEEFYPKDKMDWSEFDSYTSLQQFDDYLQGNPSLRRLSRSALRSNTVEGSAAFYSAFYVFIKREFPQSYVSILNEYFPTRFRKYDYLFDPDKAPVVFDSLRERAIGIVLHDQGLLDDPTERVNVHPRTNLRRMHSLDFLVSTGTTEHSEETQHLCFVEYHPLSPKDILNGESIQSIAVQRLSHITVDKYKNIPLFFFSKLDELFLFLVHYKVQAIQKNNGELPFEIEEMLDQSKYLQNEVVSSDYSEMNAEDASHRLLTVVTKHAIFLLLQKLTLLKKEVASIPESQAAMQLNAIKKFLNTLELVETHIELFAGKFIQFRSLLSAAQRKAYQLDALSTKQASSSTGDSRD